MLIPVGLIIIFAVRGAPIAGALTIGIVSGAIIGLAAGILTVDDFLRLKVAGKKMALVGIIPNGATMMIRQILVLVLLMGAGELLLKTGVMQSMMDKLSKMVHKPAGTEDDGYFRRHRRFDGRICHYGNGYRRAFYQCHGPGTEDPSIPEGQYSGRYDHIHVSRHPME